MATARDTALSINIVMNSAIKGANFLQASTQGIYKYAKQVEKIDLLKRTRFPLLKRNLASLENHLGKLRKVSAQISATPINVGIEKSKNTLKTILRETKEIERATKQTAFYSLKDAENRVKALKATNAENIAVNRKTKKRREHSSAVVIGTAMALTPIVMPLKTTFGFEEAITSVEAKTDTAYSKDIPLLRKTAIDLGSKTEWTMSQVAKGEEYMTMAGFKPKQISKAMSGNLALATVGDLDLGRSTDISTNILSSYKKKAAEMDRVVDVLAKTITTSNVNVEELGETMKQVGSAAYAMRGSKAFLETTALAGMLGNVGIKGEQSGTHLKGMYIRLAAPPKEAKTALSKLGISAFDNSGHAKALHTLIGELNTKFKQKHYSDKQRIEALKKIFGMIALPSAISLLNIGEDKIVAYEKKIDKSAGEALRIQKMKLDTPIGHLKLLSSAVDSLAINATSKLIPTFNSFTDKLTSGITKLSNWAKKHPELSSAIYGTAIALGVATVSLAAFGFIASGVASAIGMLSMPLTAVAGVATAGYILWKDYGNGLKFVKGFALGAKEALKDVVDVAKGIGRLLSYAKNKTISFAQSLGILNKDSSIFTHNTGQMAGKLAVYGASIYGVVKVAKFLKNTLFGVSKASKKSCNSFGCIGSSALTNSNKAKKALGGLFSKIVSLASFLKANPLIVTVSLAGAGVAYISKKMKDSIDAKRITNLHNIEQLKEREKYLKERIKSMKNPGIKEYFLYGSPNKYKIKETEKLLQRVQHKIKISQTADAAKPANNQTYKLDKTVDVAKPVGKIIHLNKSLQSIEETKKQKEQDRTQANNSVVNQTIHNVNITVKANDGKVDEHELQRQIARALKNVHLEHQEKTLKDVV